MPDSAIIQNILDEIKSLATRFDRVEGRLTSIDSGMLSLNTHASSLDGHISSLDGHVSSLDGHVSSLDGHVSSLDGHVSGLENHVSSLDDHVLGLDGRMSSFERRMSGLENRMAKIESVVADLEAEVKSWPDMHYLAAAAKSQLTKMHELKSEMSATRIRIDEIYRMMATDPEIENLREDVSRFREQSMVMEVRLGAIEGHLGIESRVDAG